MNHALCGDDSWLCRCFFFAFHLHFLQFKTLAVLLSLHKGFKHSFGAIHCLGTDQLPDIQVVKLILSMVIISIVNKVLQTEILICEHNIIIILDPYNTTLAP